MICPSCGSKLLIEKNFLFCANLDCTWVSMRNPSMYKEDIAPQIEELIEEMELAVEEMELALEKIKK